VAARHGACGRGTGNPRRFFDLLARMGIEAVPHAFPDHHAFVRPISTSPERARS